MGGLYNMMHGYNPACLFFAPMLTEENPEQYFPRFRDCYIGDNEDTIVIFTRVGGGNRGYYDEEKLYEMPEFIRTWDDDFDSTYGYYEFLVPDEWKADFEHIKAGEFDQISDAYIERIQKCFPKIDARKAISGGGGE